MRKAALLSVGALLATLFALAPQAAQEVRAGTDPVQIRVVSYDVTQTPMSGYGCWTHTYTGAIEVLDRTVSGSVSCGSELADHLANYTGGGGTLNDNIFSTSNDDNQLLLTTMDDDAGRRIEPVITLHLEDWTFVKRVSIYGGDVAWNVLPGALNAMTIEIGGKPLFMSSAAFGTPNVLGVPANDLFDIDYTEQSWEPTKTVVLKDFQADFFGWQFNQFSITEIVIEGVPATKAVIDVKPGDRDPVLITSGRGKIPVAIMGNAALDVSTIDTGGGSLTFGTYGWEVSLVDCNKPTAINKDEWPDLVCHFANYAVDWTQGFSSVRLNGWTIDGARFFGEDTMRPAPRLS